MKKLLFILFILMPNIVFAQVSYMDEAKQLGSIAGQGKVCKATKTDTFEMLSRAIILTKATDEASRDAALRAYIEEKARSYMLSGADCAEILSRFDNQEIFNINLYKDGTIKFSSGDIITPKMPYDAANI